MRKSLPTRLLVKGLDLLVPLGLIMLEITLNLLCVGTFINIMLVVLFVTSPVWLMMLIFGWPFMIAIACILRFQRIRLHLRDVTSKLVKYLLYKYEGRLRKTLWNCFYSLLSIGLANDVVAQNCGFALVS